MYLWIFKYWKNIIEYFNVVFSNLLKMSISISTSINEIKVKVQTGKFTCFI